jgi:hypothetical protein
MSATGLTLGAANYANSLENKQDNKHRSVIEAQSLNELKGISEALKKKPKVTVNLKLTPSQEKQASVARAARDALHFAKQRPIVSVGTAAGALEGVNKTTRKNNESLVGVGLRGVKNTIVGGVAGAAVGTVLEHGYNKYIRN